MNGRGHPVALTLTAGQAGDAPQAPALLAGRRRGEVKVVIADRGYDADAVLALVRRLRARCVIPPKANRRHQRRYGRALYRGRNVVERYWNRVKQCRRVATRYDKLDTSYMAFVQLASIRTVLRHP